MSSKPAAPVQMDALPYVARQVLRLIGQRQRVKVWVLTREIGRSGDLAPALDTLTQLQLIQPDQPYLRLSRAGLACIGASAHATSPNIAMTKPNTTRQPKPKTAVDLSRKSMPSTTARWGVSRPAPICNASTKELYRGNQMGASSRVGAQDFLRIPSLRNAKAQ